MSQSEQLFVAQTKGTEFTLYAVMKKMGIPLTRRQAELQAYLESKYLPVAKK